MWDCSPSHIVHCKALAWNSEFAYIVTVYKSKECPNQIALVDLFLILSSRALCPTVHLETIRYLYLRSASPELDQSEQHSVMVVNRGLQIKWRDGNI